MKKNIFYILIFILTLVSSSYGASSGGSGEGKISSSSDYDNGAYIIKKAKKLEKKGKIEKSKKLYNEALKYLYKANKENPADPDVLNYLGFANRKVDNFKDAEIYYLMGLEIDPKHVGINEYLGELYVITKRHNLAVERLEVLSDCNCKEYQELKDVIEGKKVSKY